jgi:A/G-specific adenine glycosylase
LLDWFRHHGRHDLPWQRERTPYRVWVAEVMLQQTQVATVIPYYDRFLERFPTVMALAAAPLDEVLHLWSGLGYYARARNLHRAAIRVASEHGGELPEEHAALCELPGIGHSTGAAILAQALDRRHPILDGNVKRVLARWFAIDGEPQAVDVQRRLWSASDLVTPNERACDFTQAIMDLGATVCTRHHPACERCPVASGCKALQTGRVDEFPTPRQPRIRPQRSVHWLILQHGGSVLLVQRPASGIWGGLWGFPEASEADAIRRLAAVRLGRAKPVLQSMDPIRHAFTHFELEIIPWRCEDLGCGVEAAGETWYNIRRPPALGLAAPVAGLIASLGSGT